MWVGDGISESRASEDTLRENIEVISGCDMLFILQLSVHETEMSRPEESRFWRDAIFSARDKFGFYSMRLYSRKRPPTVKSQMLVSIPEDHTNTCLCKQAYKERYEVV